MPIPAGSSPVAPPTSGPLVYDPVLSRVRLTLSGLTVEDDFTRSVAADWGTSTSGHVWTKTGGAGSDYSVTGSVGRHTHTTTNVLHYTLVDVRSPDVEVLADVTLTIGSASGAAVTNWVAGRAADASNYYAARLDLGPGTGMALVLVKRVAGVLSPVLNTALVGTHTAGATWRIRLSVAGSTVRAKAWLAAVAEPAGWQVEATDTDLTAGTLAGPLSRFEGGNTNTLPQSIDWDNITITPTVTVERSTDLVRWTTVRGGVLAASGGAIRVDDYEFAPDVVNHYRAAGYAGTIVPPLGGVWLKSVARPFLNRQVVVVDYSDVERPARAGVFNVIGRSDPVAVNDLRGSPQWTLEVLTSTPGEATDVDLLLASGDPLFVHVPAGESVPGGHVTVGDTSKRRTARRSPRRVFVLPCTNTAAPGPDVVGATVTCQGVLNAYATCQAVLDAHPTCLSLMELIGDPVDVVVP